MRVAGVEITPEQIEAGLAAMVALRNSLSGNGQFFRTKDVVGALSAAGVIWSVPSGNLARQDAMPAYEAANRLLQRERKAGRIRHIGGGKWVRVEQEVGDDAD